MRRVLRGAAPLFILFTAALLLSQQQGTKPKDDYDPDKLTNGEVGCGRPGSKKSPECRCMNERMKKINALYEECDLKYAGQKEKYKACVLAIPGCPDIKVVDAEEARKEGTPAMCRRDCTKGRCECKCSS